MIKQALAGVAVLLALTACDPERGAKPPSNGGHEQQVPIPGVNAEFTTLYVLAHAYLNGAIQSGVVSAEVKGTLVSATSHEKVQVTEGRGCRKHTDTSMICGLPTKQHVDMTGVESIVFTFSLSTNVKGWQLGCEISTNSEGAAGILDQDYSDRTSGTKAETIVAVCSFP